MNKLERIIGKYNYEALSNDKKIFESELNIYEKEIGVKFGPQLREYIINYGYIACEHIEFFGINSKQNINSDMITMTKNIHDISPNTKKLIAIENQGDGDYYLVDSNDYMYRFVLDDSLSCINLNKDLFEYINERLESIK